MMEVNSLTPAAIIEKRPKLNYYDILGVTKDASDKDIETAYGQLVIKYQSASSPEHEETCKNINEAFFVLCDPNKRRLYDNTGEVPVAKIESGVDEPSNNSMDVSNLGGIGRVFGAVISRLGIPIHTTISSETLQVAESICKNGGIQSAQDPRLNDLYWGWGTESKVDRQCGMFFRLTVEEVHVEKGFVLYCRSPSKGKFKLVIFDADGSIMFQEDCNKSRDKAVTHAALYFTNFGTYRLGETTASESLADIPALFTKLDNFAPTAHTIIPGQYLVCVYGDNFLGKTSFAILAIAAHNECPEVTEIQEIDEKIRVFKQNLDTFKVEYLKTVDAYNKALRRVEEDNRVLEDMLDRREEVYKGFLTASAKAHSSESPPPPQLAKGPPPSSLSKDTIVEAGAAATAAGGWLARQLSSSMGQLSKSFVSKAKAVAGSVVAEEPLIAEEEVPVEGKVGVIASLESSEDSAAVVKDSDVVNV